MDISTQIATSGTPVSTLNPSHTPTGTGAQTPSKGIQPMEVADTHMRQAESAGPSREKCIYRYLVADLPDTTFLPGTKPTIDKLLAGINSPDFSSSDKKHLKELNTALGQNTFIATLIMAGEHTLYNWVLLQAMKIDELNKGSEQQQEQARAIAFALDTVCSRKKCSLPWRELVLALNFNHIHENNEKHFRQYFPDFDKDKAEFGGIDFYPPWMEETEIHGANLYDIYHAYWQCRVELGREERHLKFSKEQFVKAFPNLHSWMKAYSQMDQDTLTTQGLPPLNKKAFEFLLSHCDKDPNSVPGNPKWNWRSAAKLPSQESPSEISQNLKLAIKEADLEDLMLLEAQSQPQAQAQPEYSGSDPSTSTTSPGRKRQASTDSTNSTNSTDSAPPVSKRIHTDSEEEGEVDSPPAFFDSNTSDIIRQNYPFKTADYTVNKEESDAIKKLLHVDCHEFSTPNKDDSCTLTAIDQVNLLEKLCLSAVELFDDGQLPTKITTSKKSTDRMLLNPFNLSSTDPHSEAAPPPVAPNLEIVKKTARSFEESFDNMTRQLQSEQATSTRQPNLTAEARDQLSEVIKTAREGLKSYQETLSVLLNPDAGLLDKNTVCEYFEETTQAQQALRYLLTLQPEESQTV